MKDNREELLGLSRRIEHILNSLEDSRRRDVLRPDEYNDAMTTVSKYGGFNIAGPSVKLTLPPV